MRQRRKRREYRQCRGDPAGDTSLQLKIGETKQLTATIFPEDAQDAEIAWTSDDQQTVSVSDNGLVTAIAAGTTNIYSECENGVKAMCSVRVTDIVVYCAGFSRKADGTNVAGYWKNGVWNALPATASAPSAAVNSIAVSDTEFIAAGECYNETTDLSIADAKRE